MGGTRIRSDPNFGAGRIRIQDRISPFWHKNVPVKLNTVPYRKSQNFKNMKSFILKEEA